MYTQWGGRVGVIERVLSVKWGSLFGGGQNTVALGEGKKGIRFTLQGRQVIPTVVVSVGNGVEQKKKKKENPALV